MPSVVKQRAVTERLSNRREPKRGFGGRYPIAFVLVLFCLSGTGRADQSTIQAATSGALDGPRLLAQRIAEPIEVDGALSEPAWQAAQPVRDFLQREPVEGGPPTEATEVRVLYDDEFFYLGFTLHDDSPDGIIATDQRRDSIMAGDDTIAVIIDTFHDHRNGFVFQTNPLGTKLDMLIRNEGDVNREWSESWESAARITAAGWEAEMAIPWKSLRYPAGSHVWGIDFRRQIRRKNEEVYWSNYSQDFTFTQVSRAGHLDGLDDLRLTDRFRIKPFVTTGFIDKDITIPKQGRDVFDAGLEDMKIQVRPGLVADFTVNTDFSEVSVDTAQVNLTRFSLFFPEQREFFLEGNNNFRFGPSSTRGTPLALLFFSRRIGLDSRNEPIPIDGGAKLTGKVGGLTIGALNVVTGNPSGRRAENFGVVRLQHDVLSRSRIGMLVTNRTGGGSFNRVVGADGNFTFYDNLDVGGWVARATDSGVEGDRWAGQGFATWDSDLWTFSADLLRIAPDFNAGIGFIQRRDIVRQNYRIGWKPRPRAAWVRQVSMFGTLEHIADLSGALQSRRQGTFVNVRLESGDSFSASVNDNFERLDRPFQIDPRVAVPVGDHRFQDARFGFTLFSGRAVAGDVNVNLGEFFNGTRQSVTLAPTIRIGRRIQTTVSYSYNRIDLPQGRFATHLVNSGFSYAFDDRWLTDTVVQFSDVSGLVTIFAQLDYLYRPNDDIFVIYEQVDGVSRGFAGQTDHKFVVKMTRSFDF